MENAEIKIEPLNTKTIRNDIEMLCRLEREVFGIDSYPRYFFRQSAEILGDTFLVCRDSKRSIIGYLLGAIKHGTDGAWVLSMCVEDAFRKKGIGAALLKNFFSLLEQKSVRHVFAAADPKNHAAINLYLKLGFKIQKMEEDYHGKGYPRYLLKKSLESRPE